MVGQLDAGIEIAQFRSIGVGRGEDIYRCDATARRRRYADERLVGSGVLKRIPKTVIGKYAKGECIFVFQFPLVAEVCRQRDIHFELIGIGAMAIQLLVGYHSGNHFVGYMYALCLEIRIHIRVGDGLLVGSIDREDELRTYVEEEPVVHHEAEHKRNLQLYLSVVLFDTVCREAVVDIVSLVGSYGELVVDAQLHARLGVAYGQTGQDTEVVLTSKLRPIVGILQVEQGVETSVPFACFCLVHQRGSTAAYADGETMVVRLNG